MVFLPANRADHFLWACQILPGLRQPLPKISRSQAPLDADNFRHREFPQALRRAGLCRVRFHDLRHTYTSVLIATAPIRRSRRNSTSSSLAVRRRRLPGGSRRYAWDGHRVGAKWEQFAVRAGNHGSKMGAEITKGLAT